jgi:hypothetical protein
MKRRLFILALGAALAASPALAQQGQPRGFAPQQDMGSQWAPRNQREERVQEVPLSAVLRDIRSDFGGQHLDAQRRGDRYVVFWLTDDGRRLTIEVDARTGRRLSVR